MTNQEHTEKEQLVELRRGLDLNPDEIPLSQIIPLLVPASFFGNGQWPGPYSLLRASKLAITWAALMPKQTMTYVSHQMVGHWDSQHLDWRRKAMDNLVGLTNDDIATHHFTREDGSLYGLAMMHEDGCGPSRLLLNERLVQTFPEGYRIAVPEMSVGVAFSVRLSAFEQGKMENLVARCFEKGTRPVSPLLYDSSALVAS